MATKFKISHSKEMYKLITSNLYTNKHRAILRELCCNAYDSHIKAGTTDVPIEVSILPNMVSIRDYGTGLSPEAIEGMYSTIFASDKTNDDTQNGAFGVGSKSPFAYAETFAVESRYNGRTYLYMAEFSSQEPTIVDMHPGGIESPDATNGVEIHFSLKTPRDQMAFASNVKLALSGIDNIVIKFEKNKGFIPLSQKNRLHLLHGAFVAYEDESIIAYYDGAASSINSTKRSGDIYLLIGNVYYEMPQLSRPSIDFHTFVLKGKIGEYEIAASRENVQLAEEDIKKLQATCDAAYYALECSAKEYKKNLFEGKEFHEAVALLKEKLPNKFVRLEQPRGDFTNSLMHEHRLDPFLHETSLRNPDFFHGLVAGCYARDYNTGDLALDGPNIVKFVTNVVGAPKLKDTIDEINNAKKVSANDLAVVSKNVEGFFHTLSYSKSIADVEFYMLKRFFSSLKGRKVYIVDPSSLPKFKKGKNAGMTKPPSAMLLSKLKTWVTQNWDQAPIILYSSAEMFPILNKMLVDANLLAMCDIEDIKSETVTHKYFKVLIDGEVNENLSTSMSRSLVGARLFKGGLTSSSSAMVSSLGRAIGNRGTSALFYDSYEGLVGDRINRNKIGHDMRVLEVVRAMQGALTPPDLLVVRSTDFEDVKAVSDFKKIPIVPIREVEEDIKRMWGDFVGSIENKYSVGAPLIVYFDKTQEAAQMSEPELILKSSYDIEDYFKSPHSNIGRVQLAKSLPIEYEKVTFQDPHVKIKFSGTETDLSNMVAIIESVLLLFGNRINIKTRRSGKSHLEDMFTDKMRAEQDRYIVDKMPFIHRAYIKTSLTVEEANQIIAAVKEA